MVCWLGIDYGLERTGLALAPEEIAFPLRTLRLSDFGRRSALLDAIASAARENGAAAIVLGLPLMENGGESLMARQIRNITARLKRRLSLPFYYMPELLSSFEAREDLRRRGLNAARIRKALDQQAACRILASFLAQPRRLWMEA